MAVTRYYEFGASSFSHFVWLQSGAPLKNIRDLAIEMVNAGRFGVEVWAADSDSKLGSGQRANPIGGWHTFDFYEGSDLNGEFIPPIPDGLYRVRLVNLTDGTRQVRGGTLRMVDKRPFDGLIQYVSDVFGRLFR